MVIANLIASCIVLLGILFMFYFPKRKNKLSYIILFNNCKFTSTSQFIGDLMIMKVVILISIFIE